jgi:hypothetical protein
MSRICIRESVAKNGYISLLLLEDTNNKIPSDSESNYSDTYYVNLQDVHTYLNSQIEEFKNFSGKSSDTIDENGKTMKQRYLDLFTMQVMFKGILSKLTVAVYGDDYLNLKNIEIKNLQIRNNMETDLKLYQNENPNKKAQLDSTVYSAILLIILAIILIYYLFMHI